MTRAAQVMEVMRRAPGQDWTASEISAQLGCAPSVVRTALAGLRVAGQVVRVDDGVHRLPSAQPTAQPPASAALPPPTEPAVREPPQKRIAVQLDASEAATCRTLNHVQDGQQRAAILTALRDAGRPLHRAELQTRTRHLVDWPPGTFFLTVTAMVEAGQLREWADRTVVLPGFRGRL